MRVAIWPRRAAARARMASWASSGGGAGVDRAGDGAGQGLDVGLERGVVADVAGSVGADDDQDRGAGAAGVVQVGQAVGQAGAEVQQYRGGAARDAGVAVLAAPVATPSNRASTPRIAEPSPGPRRSASPTYRGS